MLLTRKSAGLGVVIVSVALLAGCKNDYEKLVEFSEAEAKIADNVKDEKDCDKAADDLKKLRDDKYADIKKIRQKFKDNKPSKEEEAKFKEKYGERMGAASKKLIGMMLKCLKNEKFDKVFKDSKD